MGIQRWFKMESLHKNIFPLTIHFFPSREYKVNNLLFKCIKHLKENVINRN